ncbi:CHAT domain-containing protein [Rhizobium sp. BR 249]|uniref:CHAT domain-containing protein n=1 Tax=Rhizobium sp. BR 249 TaxID=3040011 RepID=UPI0039BF6CE3
MKIVYIASRTPTAESLAIEREIMDLNQSIAEASYDVVQPIFLPDVTIEELPLFLSRHKPDILHIAVHGTAAGLWFAREPFDGEGERQPVEVSGEALADLLDPLALPKLVFLNACESQHIAKILAGRGMLAIGTSAPIVDQAAVAISRLMYERLLSGLNVTDAFRAMAALVSCHQGDGIKLHLAVPDGGSAAVPLYSRPAIIARLDPDTETKSGGPIDCYIGVLGAPSETVQIVFFTADETFVAARPKLSLEEKLTEVVRDMPRRGEIWTKTAWRPSGNIRIAACGISPAGKTFTATGMLVEALDQYAHNRPSSAAYKKALAEARIALLENESDGSISDWPG